MILVALTLASCSTAATPSNDAAGAGASPRVASSRSGSVQSGAGGSAYNPSVAVYPDETAHVIGGQTFYFNRYTPFPLR
jgi:hypothetical protein